MESSDSDLAFFGIALGSFLWIFWQALFRDHPRLLIFIGPTLGTWAALRLIEDRIRILDLPARQSAVLAFFALALPIISYGSGALRAKAVATGTVSGYSDATISNGGTAIVGQARYLGTLGEFAFFWTRDETVRIAKWDQVLPLELGRAMPKPDGDADDEPDEP